MNPNPFLTKLGFSPTDRVAIIHADDVGMCQATLPAIADLLDFGLVSSAAIMVPCPWFPGTAQYAREHPGVDFGVHLTLNSEWRMYRWGPLSTREAASGLLDGQGYFHDRTEPTQGGANLSAVRIELDTQLMRARAAGIDPTHADTHMFCLGHPRLFETYLQSALNAGTLPLILRPSGPGWHKLGLPDDGALFSLTEQLIEQEVPMVDDVCWMSLETDENHLEEAKQHFDELQPGFTHFILHPAVDSLEIRAVASDWRCRVADYETFMSEELRDYVREIGVQVIGYRALKDAMK